MVERHIHNGVDSEQLTGQAFEGAPLAALTFASGASLSSGGTEAMTTADANILNNLITRLNELEDRLQSLGLLS